MNKYFFFKNKSKMLISFLASKEQMEESIRPRKHTINVVDRWLWKCGMISKVHTVSNTLYISLGKKTKICWFVWDTCKGILTCPDAARQKYLALTICSHITKHIYTNIRLCPQVKTESFRPHYDAEQVHHLTYSEYTFINMYKSITGTWNVFGWNNPTLQDNVFTEC